MRMYGEKHTQKTVIKCKLRINYRQNDERKTSFFFFCSVEILINETTRQQHNKMEIFNQVMQGAFKRG